MKATRDVRGSTDHYSFKIVPTNVGSIILFNWVFGLTCKFALESRQMCRSDFWQSGIEQSECNFLDWAVVVVGGGGIDEKLNYTIWSVFNVVEKFVAKIYIPKKCKPCYFSSKSIGFEASV